MTLNIQIMASDLRGDIADLSVQAFPFIVKPHILFFFRALIYMGLVRYKYFPAVVQSGLSVSVHRVLHLFFSRALNVDQTVC
ncbi:hypothetical protein [Desulfosarcina widdelii]|uniref:hypothetical protein n=1 Tax=Desulfosarcina widdelii TaxID=947919 RepID=UPI0012D2DDD8|nr:hypothetical protein [Desulfosarcina widdelii]